jgi:hypothetical protein
VADLGNDDLPERNICCRVDGDGLRSRILHDPRVMSNVT